MRAEPVPKPDGQPLETRIVLNIEGLGAITLPRGLKPEDFPRKSFENIALAMKRVYQADIAAKLPSRVAVASAKTVAETMARHLQGEGGLKQAFIESAVTMITNEPSVLLNKLENLANYIWKDNQGLEDQPGDFTYRKAISTIMIEISKLVDANNSNQRAQS